MRELVRYLCSSCGGALIVDRHQGVYDCPFCGNAFDGAAMHRDEILADAENNLKQREFHSAKEKFDSILANDPNDFDALRGLVLCAGKLPSVNTLRKPDKVNDGDTEGFKKALDDIRKRAREEDLPYFEKMSEMLDIARAHKQLIAERSKQDKQYGIATEEHKEKHKNYGCFTIFLFLSLVVGVFILFLSDPNIFLRNSIIIFPAAITIFALIAIIPDKIENKKFDKIEHGYRKRKIETDNKLSEVEEKYSNAYAELNKLDMSDKGVQAPVESAVDNLTEE